MKSVRWYREDKIFALEFCSFWCRERTQTARYCSEWLGRLKCLAAGLDAFLSYFWTCFASCACAFGLIGSNIVLNRFYWRSLKLSKKSKSYCIEKHMKCKIPLIWQGTFLDSAILSRRGNKQQVRHFRRHFDIEYWTSSVPCYASRQRWVHCLLSLPNEPTSSATKPACSSGLRA